MKKKLVFKNSPFIIKYLRVFIFGINSQNSQKFIPANNYTNNKVLMKYLLVGVPSWKIRICSRHRGPGKSYVFED